MSVVRIARWLLSHKEAALKIYEAAKGWTPEMSLVEKWAIVDAVARIVIPILVEEGMLWASSDIYDDDTEVMALGGEVATLGIPWAAITTIIFPLMQLVFDFILREEEA